MSCITKPISNPLPISNGCLISLPNGPIKISYPNYPSRPIKISCSFSSPLPLRRKPHFPKLVVHVSSDWAQQEESSATVAEAETEAEEETVFNWGGDVTESGEGEGEGEGDVTEEEEYVEPPEEAKLFVGNLPYDVDSEKLAQLFEQAGVVEIAEVVEEADGTYFCPVLSKTSSVYIFYPRHASMHNKKMSSMAQSLWQQGSLFLAPFSSPFLILFSSFGLVFIIKYFLFRPTTSPKNPPPSPKRLPIIGNLHQLALPLHHSLFSLSKQYGPIMLLHLGCTPAVVISSPEAAHEVMKTHDLAFASRYEFKINKKLLYDSREIATAPYGEYWRQMKSMYWRQMKSIFVLQLLSNTRVRSFRVAREKRTAKLMEKIERSLLTELNVSELLVTLTFDILCEVAFGKTKTVGGERGERFKKSLVELMKIVGGFDLEEVIPWLAWVSRVSGKDSRVERVAKGIDGVLEDVVQEHMDRHEEGTSKQFDDEDFADILLKIQKDKSSGVSIDRDGVKGLLLDAFAAGTDTTSTLLEWEMSELLKHPRVMKRLQDEIRGIAKGKYNITEEDLEKANYLKAVVKETLRLHPPAPMPAPREARQDAKVMGYDVAAKTMVIVNLWAIGRDPKAWENPDEYKPDRFLGSSMDFKGNDFQFIPFGAGRRGCPGISFAIAVNEIVLANLVNKFDWELPKGMRAEDLDMTESSDFTIHRKTSLLAVAIPYSYE